MNKNDFFLVKNYQTDQAIKNMYREAFNKSSDNIKISKLSGGLKNAVYLIEDESKKVVLKIAPKPKDEIKMITVDRGVLWWEVEMLKLMEAIDFPSPRLLYYDDKSRICESSYMFMSYISGSNYLECKDNLTQKEIENIEHQLGNLCSIICSIKRENFFLPAQPDKIFNSNYEFVSNLFELLLNDASERNMDLGVDRYRKIRNIVEMRKDSLNNVSNLCLSHTDAWDGNIIIDNGNIAGIVDFSDLYHCDELLTFYFHTIDGKTSDSFLKGFNDKQLSYDEKIRIEIYRMYVILKMIIDCELKQYGKFNWMYDNLETRIKILQKI